MHHAKILRSRFLRLQAFYEIFPIVRKIELLTQEIGRTGRDMSTVKQNLEEIEVIRSLKSEGQKLRKQPHTLLGRRHLSDGREAREMCGVFGTGTIEVSQARESNGVAHLHARQLG
eukprot:COSAG01_NODE_11389_length_1946_cov_13.726650_1_plen_115_part_10